MKKYKASVVMPTFQKKERMVLTLESFRYQTIKKDEFEIIIVDDGSEDGTDKLVKQYEDVLPLRYIRQKNKGRSVARNTGIRQASSDLILFCDDDLIVSPSFVEAHVKAHEDKVCVAHGQIYNLPYLKFFRNPETGEPYDEFKGQNMDFMKQYCIQKDKISDIEKIHKLSKVTLIEKTIQSIFHKELSELKWLCCSGANVSIPKMLLESVGYFDERLGKAWGAEDFELGYRLHQAHAEFIYLEEGHNYHMMHARMNFKEALEASVKKFYECHPDANIKYLDKLLSGEIRDIDSYIKYVKMQEKGEKSDGKK